MRRLLGLLRRPPARPPAGEVAGPSVGMALQPYIGELPLHPQLPARDAWSHTDETDALRLYRQTLRDERCAAALEQRLNAAISTPWEVEAGGAMARDRKAAEDLREQLENVEFDRICKQLLHAVWYGWAVGEAMWTRDGARVSLGDLVVRSPDRFWWSPEGELLLRTWRSPQGEPVPDAKFVVLARPGEHGDLPYAPGLARWCFWPVWLKRHGLRFWSVALERFGAPTAKGTYPRAAGPEEKDRLLSLVSSLGSAAGVVVPDDQDIELLQSAQRSGSSGGMSFDGFIGYLDRAITTTILGQSSTTDQGPWRGTAEVQKDVRDETIAADARLLDSALNVTIAQWLTHWNFPGAAVPRIRHDADPPEDLDARAAREKVISETSGLRPTERHVIDVYGGEWKERPAAAGMGEGAGGGDGDPDPPPPAPPAKAGDAGGDPPCTEFASEDDEDPVAGLLDRAREQIGPLVDRWADAIREQADNADSLEGVRERLDAMEIDVEPAARVLGSALTAALAAGRFDADAPFEAELAEPASLEHTRLPFAEQIEFFRSKLNLPSASWTELWHEGHDVGFVVAGAMRDDLLSDLRGAVDQAIAEGTTLETFRGEFDAIVAKHGWSYNGGRDWRTRVIYDTNLRTSYAAGRYQQLQDITDRRPYWRYRHSHASEHPRPEHLAWDGLVLRHDNPWWSTHYTPNGWGCKCYVEALNERDLKRLGKSGPDSAPRVAYRTVTVGERGPSPRTVEVPEGIDPGWAYAPGESVVGESVRQRLERSVSQPAEIAGAGIAAMLARPRILEALTGEWRAWRGAGARRGRQAEAFALGALHPRVLRWLREEKGVDVANAMVTVSRRELSHAAREDKVRRGAALGPGDLDRLPEIIARPEAVLYDTDRPGDLLYVFTGDAVGKVVVRVNYTDRLRLDGADRRATVISNSVRTAGYVQAGDLEDPRYEPIERRPE